MRNITGYQSNIQIHTGQDGGTTSDGHGAFTESYGAYFLRTGSGSWCEAHMPLKFDANANTLNYGNPMAGHATGIDIHPYAACLLPVIAY